MPWAIGPWGITPWGAAVPTEFAAPTDVLTVNIYAEDLLELVFNEAVLNDDELLSVDSYTIVPFNPSDRPVYIREIRSDSDASIVDRVYVVVSKPTLGSIYTLTITGVVSADDGSIFVGTTVDILTRRTKVDHLCTSLPSLYNVEAKSQIRNLMNAIGYADDQIGGEQEEDD